MDGIFNMTTYTNLTKPSGTSYTNQNTVGKQQYDQSDITFDDANVFYDGLNLSQYTKVDVGVYGLWLDSVFPWLLGSPWTTVATNYTKITKPV